MNPYFTEENLEKLYNGYYAINNEKNDLIIKYYQYSFKSEKAQEFAMHGLMRRISVINRAIHNIFEVCPPENMEPLEHDITDNIAINLHAIVINTFGCLDNIAWVWVYERNLKIDKNRIGLTHKHKKIRDNFSIEFKKKLEEFDPWCKEYIKNYRDALAHRIPLYVPSVSFTNDDEKLYNKLEKEKWDALANSIPDKAEKISQKQKKIGRFYPWMQHSYSERSTPVVFHAQILADWATIINLTEKFYEELSNSTQTTHRE